MTTTRLAREADAKHIAEVYVETWRTTYAGSVPDRVLIDMSIERQTAYWARAIRHKDEIVCVAEEDAYGIVGVGSAGAVRRKNSPYFGEVYTLYIQTDHQNLGIGEKLLARLFNEMIESGLYSAVIWALASNNARFFYETMGGKRVGERTERMWGVDLKEIAYGWDNLAAALRAGRPSAK